MYIRIHIISGTALVIIKPHYYDNMECKLGDRKDSIIDKLISE